MAKRIYLIAYIQSNIGDDLFINIICRRYPQVEFYIRAEEDKRAAFEGIGNLNYIGIMPLENVLNKSAQRRNRFVSYAAKALRRIYIKLVYRYAKYKKNKCDAVVKIGGSIFMEKSFQKVKKLDLEKIKPYEQNERTVLNIRNNYFIIGANLGPVYTMAYLDEVADELRRARAAVFRDKTSYNIFKGLKNVSYAPDVVFNLDCDKLGLKNKKQVFITPIDPDYRFKDWTAEQTDKYYAKYAEICGFYMNKGYNVVLAAFCEPEKDMIAIENICGRLYGTEKNRLEIIAYTGNIKNILQKMQESEYIICGRFHCIVLSLLFGKRFLPICYSDKMNHILKDIDFKGTVFEIEDLSQANLESVDRNRNNTEIINIDKYIKEAAKQFEGLDRYLNRK